MNPSRFYYLTSLRWSLHGATRTLLQWLVTIALCGFIAQPDGARAGVPPLKPEQISLNGVWQKGGAVPVYGGEILTHKSYVREVEVPATWKDKNIRLEFEAVNYACDVFVNDKLVMTHLGAWNPFAVDITNQVKPGTSFTMRVEVRGMSLPPIIEADGQERYPLGAQIVNDDFGGIADDVWLRAYGQVAITDAFIQTSFRQRELAVDYTVTNFTDTAREVTIEADAVRAGTNRKEKTVTSDAIKLAPKESRVVRVTTVWNDAALWFPDAPELYILQSRVRDVRQQLDARRGNAHRARQQVIDSEARRFGFREIWTEGNQFRLNGVRLNIRGDYIGYGGYIPKTLQTKQSLPKVYDDLKSLNMNALRWHMHPAPAFAYDLADEKGLIIVCESAIYGRPGFMPPEIKKIYLKNARAWIAAWAKRWRTNASVLLWSVVNEMGAKYVENGHQSLTLDELKSLGAELRKYDTTRIVLYHGNAEVTDEDAINYHYPPPAGWQVVTQSIYSWASLVDKNRPTGVGEFFQTSKTARHPKLTKAQRELMAENNIWWLGIWTRGMRYVDFADFRPKIYFWAHKEMDSPRTANLRNAFNPVALLDKEYDDLGIVPFVDGEFPTLQAHTAQHRTLVLYNDEFRDESVIVEASLRVADKVLATTRRDYRVRLGHHRDLECQFDAPDSDFDLVLKTYKGGRLRFEEVKRFRINKSDAPRAAESKITLSD